VGTWRQRWGSVLAARWKTAHCFLFMLRGGLTGIRTQSVMGYNMTLVYFLVPCFF
jgi:hypothetical protein